MLMAGHLEDDKAFIDLIGEVWDNSANFADNWPDPDPTTTTPGQNKVESFTTGAMETVVDRMIDVIFFPHSSIINFIWYTGLWNLKLER